MERGVEEGDPFERRHRGGVRRRAHVVVPAAAHHARRRRPVAAVAGDGGETRRLPAQLADAGRPEQSAAAVRAEGAAAGGRRAVRPSVVRRPARRRGPAMPDGGGRVVGGRKRVAELAGEARRLAVDVVQDARDAARRRRAVRRRRRLVAGRRGRTEHHGALGKPDLPVDVVVLADAVLEVRHLGLEPRPARRDGRTLARPRPLDARTAGQRTGRRQAGRTPAPAHTDISVPARHISESAAPRS